MIDLEDLPRLESLSPIRDVEAYHMTILDNKEPDKSTELMKSLNSCNEKDWQNTGNQQNFMPELNGCRYISQVSTSALIYLLYIICIICMYVL